MAGPHTTLAAAIGLAGEAIEHGSFGDVAEARAAVTEAARRVLTARADDDATTRAAAKRLLTMLSALERALEVET